MYLFRTVNSTSHDTGGQSYLFKRTDHMDARSRSSHIRSSRVKNSSKLLLITSSSYSIPIQVKSGQVILNQTNAKQCNALNQSLIVHLNPPQSLSSLLCLPITTQTTINFPLNRHTPPLALRNLHRTRRQIRLHHSYPTTISNPTTKPIPASTRTNRRPRPHKPRQRRLRRTLIEFLRDGLAALGPRARHSVCSDAISSGRRRRRRSRAAVSRSLEAGWRRVGVAVASRRGSLKRRLCKSLRRSARERTRLGRRRRFRWRVACVVELGV
jgi:hypothetical protein